MEKTLLIPKQIVTANPENEILRNFAVEIDGNVITRIASLSEIDTGNYDGLILHYPSLTLIPGFVQTHIHLCQTLFRGCADDLELLDWLQKKIFPFENAHDENSLRMSAKIGINELITGGTTTILDMGTINHQEIIFEELITSGIRAIAGKCMVDINDLLPEFRESTEDSIRTSYDLAKQFHDKENGRIKYGFAPRFVLSCTEKLLKETALMAEEFVGSIYHTHSSENKSEIEEVRRLHSKENIEYFNHLGILNNWTILAHCVHTSENEIEILKRTDTRIAHCPSSNLKLGSGIANIPRYIKEGIKVSLGADGAPCNNNLSAFTEMRLAALIQKPFHSPTVMNAQNVFRLATIDGAKALNLDNDIGSIEVGKKADLVMLNLESPNLSLSEEDNSIYSNIVYSCTKESVREVIIDGEWNVKSGRSLLYDETELYFEGQQELKNLLKRI
ncbi:MAG: 5'-deoxyadenosine deaminase [Ignavibacteriales bacterium]|nr:5'-deoxyadenosine deaminase [Ignavibacteriales bacterium]